MTHEERKKPADEPVWRLSNPYKWYPTSNNLKVIGYVSILNDNTMTTEETNRAIKCDRSNDKFAWMHNRHSLEPLDQKGAAIK